MTKYLKSFNWAVQCLTTVGWGDILAYNNVEMIFAMTWMFIGIFFYSFMVFSLAMYFSQSLESGIITKMAFIDEFCRESNLSKEINLQIKNEILYNQAKGFFNYKLKT